MKKTLAIALALVLCLGLLAACGEPASDPTDAPVSDAPQSEAPSNEPIELSGTVVVNGSTSMEKVMGYLKEGFAEVQPGITINYTASGSSAGITGAQDGTCDIGMASRALKDSELEAGLVPTTIAMDGIAVIVNNENTLTGMTSEQVTKVFTGEITNWADLAE